MQSEVAAAQDVGRKAAAASKSPKNMGKRLPHAWIPLFVRCSSSGHTGLSLQSFPSSDRTDSQSVGSSLNGAGSLSKPGIAAVLARRQPGRLGGVVNPVGSKSIGAAELFADTVFSTRMMLSSPTVDICSTLVSSFGDSGSIPMKQAPTAVLVSWLSADGSQRGLIH